MPRERVFWAMLLLRLVFVAPWCDLLYIRSPQMLNLAQVKPPPAPPLRSVALDFRWADDEVVSMRPQPPFDGALARGEGHKPIWIALHSANVMAMLASTAA